MRALQGSFNTSMAGGDLSVEGCENEQYMWEWQSKMMEAKGTYTEYRLRSSKEKMLHVGRTAAGTAGDCIMSRSIVIIRNRVQGSQESPK